MVMQTKKRRKRVLEGRTEEGRRVNKEVTIK
jgi:hypothetical protein